MALRTSIGILGLQDFQGSQGVQGFQNASGFYGAQGYQGLIANQSAQGFQPVQGFQGFQGFQGACGLLGLQSGSGLQGFQGFNGPQGVQGVIASLVGPLANWGNQGNQGWQGVATADKIKGWNGVQGLTSPYTGFQGVQGTSAGNSPVYGFQGGYGWVGRSANSLAAGSITVPVTLSNNAGAYSASAAITLGPPIAPTVAMITNGYSVSDTFSMSTLYGVAVTGVNIATASGYPSTSWNATIQYYQQSNGPSSNAYSSFYAGETGFAIDNLSSSSYARFQINSVNNIGPYGGTGGYIYGAVYPTPSPTWTFTVSWTFEGFSYTNSTFTWLPDIHEDLYTLGNSGGSQTFVESIAISSTNFLLISLDGDLSGGATKTITFTITAPNIPDTSLENQSFTLNYLYVV